MYKADSSYLSEEPLAASPSRRWVVDVDIVVFRTHRLLHKGLREHLPVHLHMVLPLHQVALCTKPAVVLKGGSTGSLYQWTHEETVKTANNNMRKCGFVRNTTDLVIKLPLHNDPLATKQI